MSKYTNPLEQVRVAAPCTADWEKMVGDERMRYCDRCSLHVYNLSGMSRREAEALVAGTEGRLCLRFYRRGDGTILTRNCPVGLSALKRRVARVAGSVLTAVLGFFTGLGLNFGLAPVPEESRHTMGAIAMPVEQGDKFGATPVEDSVPLVVEEEVTVEAPGEKGEWRMGKRAPSNYTPLARVPPHTRRAK